MMKKQRQLAALVGIAALCGIAAWIVLEWFSLPPLLANLPSGTSNQVSEAFNHRLAAKFPIATPERDLIDELLREGFRPRRPTAIFPYGPVSGYQNSYEIDRSGFPCRTTSGVYWNADANARLTDVVGQKGGICL